MDSRTKTAGRSLDRPKRYTLVASRVESAAGARIRHLRLKRMEAIARLQPDIRSNVGA